MCNLYSMKSNQEAIRDLANYIGDFTGNMQPLLSHFSELPSAHCPQQWR